LSIEVPPETVREELDKAYAHLSRQVRIDGFRPGKAPRRILEQRYKAQVEDDVKQRVVERSFFAAIEEKKVPAVSGPTVTKLEFRADAPFTFEARVEVKPKVDPKDYKALALKKEKRDVTDAEIDEQLKQLQERASRLEPVQGRTVTSSGDFAVVDIRSTIEGKPYPGGDGQNVTVEVTPGDLVDSHAPALEGTAIGATKAFDYAFPKEYRVEELGGKVAHFELTVRELKTKVLPALDDAFAKESGLEVETLDALKKKLREDLENAASSKADTTERDGLMSALVERNAFEVPSAMVERAIDSMLDGALRSLARSGVDPRMLNLDFETLRGEMRERAVKEVKGALLLEAISEKETIAATDEEVDQRIEKMAVDAAEHAAALRKHFRKPKERESLALRIREEKTVEFLKAAAKYS
ncbi:MAG: trigger factor, partial [Myxococcaceae bacterium]